MVRSNSSNIHRSIWFSELLSGSWPLTFVPFIMAKRVAFHILVAKFRAPAIHSSARAWSVPGFAPRAKANLRASDPYLSINSNGSITFPLDFDIFLPFLSLTRPCSAITSNGCFPSIANNEKIIMRATQKKRMS